MSLRLCAAGGSQDARPADDMQLAGVLRRVRVPGDDEELNLVRRS